MTFSLPSSRRGIASLAAAALLVGACGGTDETDPTRTQRDREPRKRPSPSASASVAVVTPSPEPGETEPVAECSTSGMKAFGAEPEGLTAEAAAMRQAILDAAFACDFDELARLGLEGDGHFQFTYGAGKDPAAYWREIERSGQTVLAPLVTILGLPFVEDEFGTGTKGKRSVRSYSWPSAHQAEPSEADWQALVDAGLYTQKQVDQMRAGGSGYLGWRAGITASGDWIFFIAGD